MVTRSVMCLCLALAGASLFTGCSNDKKAATTQPALQPLASPPIADVPLPDGFSMSKSKSYSNVIPGSGLRIVDHLYTGYSNDMSVVRFYRENMTRFGWNFVSQTQAREVMIMNFAKNTESSTVTIEGGMIQTSINVKISPAANTPPRR